MKCYRYKISALSGVILSPREQQFFLKDGDRIYPFYQYGAYDQYDPKRAQYYIPGSSIKGAMKASEKTSEKKTLRIDDVRINPDDIALTCLAKVQHILCEKELEKATENKSRKSLKLDTFFPHIKFEILKSDCAFDNQRIYAESDAQLCGVLKNTRESAEKRLHVYKWQITNLLERYRNHPLKTSEAKDSILSEKDCIESLQKTVENIERQLCSLSAMSVNNHRNETLLFLGGHKGLLLSREFPVCKEKEVQSGIFLDKAKQLPYGIVKIGVIIDES